MNVTILGDSFVANDFLYQNLDKTEPRNRGWSRLLAHDSNIKVTNLGWSGSGPYYAIKCLEKMTDQNDTLILCISRPDRFRTILSLNNPTLDGGFKNIFLDRDVNMSEKEQNIFKSKDLTEWKNAWVGMCNHNDFELLYDGIINTVACLTKKWNRVLLMMAFDLEYLYNSMHNKKIKIPQNWTILPINLHCLSFACPKDFLKNIRPNHFDEHTNRKMSSLIKNWIVNNVIDIPQNWKSLTASINNVESNIILCDPYNHN